MISALIGELAPYLIAAGGVLVALVSAWLGIKSNAKAKERLRQAEKRLEDVSESKAIEDAIAGRDADANRKELKEWKSGR